MDILKFKIISKKNYNKLIDESQSKILEELQKNNKTTNDLGDFIKGTRDLKKLMCILNGDLDIRNIVEFIKGC